MRSIAVVVLGGVVTAAVLFGVTSWTPEFHYLGTGVGQQHVGYPGFDPWTGEPHGRILDVSPLDGSGTITRITGEPPEELVGRQAVPLPVGFAIGALIVLVWLTAISRARP